MIAKLSRIATGEARRPPAAGKVHDWLRERSLIIHTSRGVELAHGAATTVQRLLRGIGAEAHLVRTIGPDYDRARTRKVAAYEKTGSVAVGRNRILVRAIPGAAIQTTKWPIALPKGASIDLDMDEALSTIRATCIMLIENRLCFDSLERLRFRPDIYDSEPLVLFKGSFGTSMAHARYMKAAGLDVHVFGDQDPAGVAMAISTPEAVALVEPPLEMIEEEIARAPNHDLHGDQMVYAERLLLNAPAWASRTARRIMRTRSAVPQESFLN